MAIGREGEAHVGESLIPLRVGAELDQGERIRRRPHVARAEIVRRVQRRKCEPIFH